MLSLQGMKRTPLALVSIMLLAGCGSGNQASYDSAKALAQATGCTQYKQDDQTTMFAADTGSCHYHGHYVGIDWFKDSTSLDNYRKIADSVGGSVILYGNDWAISCVDNKNDCSVFKDKLGGTLG